jgi:hypothetical protein
MQSALAITLELDDLALAARELADQINSQISFTPTVRKTGPTKYSTRTNCVGFICCDSAMDHEELLEELYKLLPMPTVGVSSSGGIITSKGYQDMAICLQVIAGEGETFHIDCTDTVTPQNIKGEVAKLLTIAKAEFLSSITAVLTFAPYFEDVPFDEYIRIAEYFHLQSPLFGGIVVGLDPAAKDADLLVLGEVRKDRIMLLSILGNSRPVFAVRHSVMMMTEEWHKVTGASGDTIYMIDDMTALDFLSEYGFPVDKLLQEPENSSYTLTSSPLIIRNKDQDMDILPRMLMSLDPEAGSAQMSGNIPLGAAISVGYVKRPDVAISAGECVERLLETMRENETDGYKYSAILVISCLGRYIVNTPTPETEVEAIVERLPEGITMNGFYGMGEFCPTSAIDGSFHNHAYNLSIVMMAV